MLKRAEKPGIVKQLAELVASYSIVGLIDIHKLPAPQMQTLKEKLRGKAVVKVARKRLIERALKESGKEGIDRLMEFHAVQPALLLSNENPFRLATFLDKNKSPAPAKEGDIAPKDIVVNAGPTQYPPGPVISTLQKVGLKTAVKGGKIEILEDRVVAKAGDVITPEMVAVFNLLKIEPMEIGLNLKAVWENGTVLPGNVLVIDEKEYLGRFVKAIQQAISLSVEAGYPTRENIEMLIGKAVRGARSLVMETGYPAREMIEDILSMAHAKARAVKDMANA